jgi:hypothetical protein
MLLIRTLRKLNRSILGVSLFIAASNSLVYGADGKKSPGQLPRVGSASKKVKPVSKTLKNRTLVKSKKKTVLSRKKGKKATLKQPVKAPVAATQTAPTQTVMIQPVVFNSPEPLPTQPTTENPFNLNSVRAFQISAFQSNGTSYSLGLDWDPSYSFSKQYSVHLNLGGTVFSNALTSGRFVVLEEIALGSILISDRFSVEAGPGFQQWLGQNGNHFLLASNGIYHFPNKLLSVIDRAFVGYTGVFIDDHYTNQIRLGVGLSF